MPSRADRVALERGLRLAAFALLAFCAWALTTGRKSPSRQVAKGEQLRSALTAWSRVSTESLGVDIAIAPPAVERDWLRALAGAGTAVAWSGSPAPTAMEVLPLPDPSGGFVVLAAAPAGSTAILADSLGAIDSARVTRGGAVFRAAAHTGALRSAAGGQPASAPGTDTIATRHAVVLGRAEWEARFVIAALEERGWIVDARLSVSPGIAVTQGRPLPLDTARQAVVVAVDSLAPADAAAIARFVASGGGAVLAPAAAATLPAIAAGRVGTHQRAPAVAFSAASPRNALSLDPVLPRPDAIVLERRDREVVLAARRAGAGRVVQSGYDETWRWRMAGVGDAVDQHRAWWADAVAAAAYRPVIGDRESGIWNDAAPLASLVSALGPATPPGSSAAAAVPDVRRLLAPAAILLLLCLLGEWSSRRLRGAA